MRSEEIVVADKGPRFGQPRRANNGFANVIACRQVQQVLKPIILGPFERRRPQA